MSCCENVMGVEEVSRLLTVYEEFLRTEKRASANTVSSYLRDVHQFAAAMEGKDVPLAQVAARPESVANSERAIADYISLIRGEKLLREGGEQGDDLLLAVQKKYQQKKAYMEEKT